jgi:hypothetical protein
MGTGVIGAADPVDGAGPKVPVHGMVGACQVAEDGGEGGAAGALGT